MVNPLHDLTIKEKGTAGPRQKRCSAGTQERARGRRVQSAVLPGRPFPSAPRTLAALLFPLQPLWCAVPWSWAPHPLPLWPRGPSPSLPARPRPQKGQVWLGGGGAAGTPGVVLFAQPRAGANLRAPPSVSCPEAAG